MLNIAAALKQALTAKVATEIMVEQIFDMVFPREIELLNEE